MKKRELMKTLLDMAPKPGAVMWETQIKHVVHAALKIAGVKNPPENVWAVCHEASTKNVYVTQPTFSTQRSSF